MDLHWTTRPTQLQLEYLNSGTFQPGNPNLTLPSTFHSGLNVMVDHHAHYLGEAHGYSILNHASTTTPRLYGLTILRTCHQLAAEGTQIFYRENTFVFPTQGIPRFSPFYSLHAHDELTLDKNVPWRIPGRRSRDGNPATQKQIRGAVERIFDKGAYQAAFLRKDPLSRFFTQIGRHNAEDLRCVKLEGTFKTSSVANTAVGFAEVLSIQVLVLREVCTNLQTLVLESKHGHEDGDGYWDALPGETDEEKIGGVVRMLVLGLPTLRTLQLGCYAKVPESEEWNWVQMVASDRVGLRGLREEEALRVRGEEEEARRRNAERSRKGNNNRS